MSEAHSVITDPFIHEPKGIATAAANKVYVSDGAGSGTWQKVAASQIDTTSQFNFNKGKIGFRFADISTASTQYLNIPEGLTITKLWAVLQTTISVAATTLTFENNSGGSMGTIVTGATDAAGTKYTLTPSTNNTFVAGDNLQIISDGGSTGTADLVLTIEYTITA